MGFQNKLHNNALESSRRPFLRLKQQMSQEFHGSLEGWGSRCLKSATKQLRSQRNSIVIAGIISWYVLLNVAYSIVSALTEVNIIDVDYLFVDVKLEDHPYLADPHPEEALPAPL